MKEYLVINAHYDHVDNHVGYGSRYNSKGPIGKIHNGADDNASGTAALLGLEKLFHDSHLRTKRSISLAFWDAEEKGLLDSIDWVQRLTVSLGQVVLYRNLRYGRSAEKSADPCLWIANTSAGTSCIKFKQSCQIPF